MRTISSLVGMGTSTPDDPQDIVRRHPSAGSTDPSGQSAPDAPMPIIGPAGIDSGSEVARRTPDVPAPHEDSTELARRLPPPESLYVAVFGDCTRRGRFVVGDKSSAISVFGDVVLDLREAVIVAESIDIHAYSVFGDIKILVPPGFTVHTRGFHVFGDTQHETRSTEPPGPDHRVVVLNAYGVFGDIKVRTLEVGEKEPSFWDRFRTS